ncbi:MAG TPA: methyltransferase domain-containing protein [Chitinophagaceae bacterium]|jgi:ubiquinone/menaquinone biosynthesis C-methylase UbiE|nr:methyltransferase domain-containing protein [Chitinophagaceae bacterium]
MQAIIYDIGKKWLMPRQDSADALFEEKYISLRQKEKRLYTDEELARLPLIEQNNLHYKEWRIRQQSCNRLVNYLGKKKGPLKILEVGCGNGWLSHRLSMVSGTFVTAIDINAFELRQAARVFAGVPGLQFIYGSIDSPELVNRHFDIIVFAASIQYFRSLTDTLDHSMLLLKPGGEIHILDSRLYRLGELGPASQRTEKYYNDLGFPEMTGQYFHHCFNELKPFDHKILYKPFSLGPVGRLAGLLQWSNNPFVWVSVKKKIAE